MDSARETKRAERRRHEIPSVAIVGYTNAGKSSLLNRLTGAGVLVEDALFATLDPTTRRTQTTDGRVYTLTDTVGFVRHLPHQLVEAFRSTLEEVAEADLLLHVVDGSTPTPSGQIAAVREVLADIGAADVPEMIVINKADAADPLVITRCCAREPHAVVVSARTGEGIDELLSAIEADLPQPAGEVDVLLPYERGDLVNQIHRTASSSRSSTPSRRHACRCPRPRPLANELAAYSVEAERRLVASACVASLTSVTSQLSPIDKRRFVVGSRSVACSRRAMTDS